MGTQKAKCILAPHEIYCLQLAKQGLSNAAIAIQKVVTLETVEQVFHHIYRKLGITGLPPSGKRQTAIKMAEERGWI